MMNKKIYYILKLKDKLKEFLDEKKRIRLNTLKRIR